MLDPQGYFMSLDDDELDSTIVSLRHQLRQSDADILEVGYTLQVAEQEQDRRHERRLANEAAVKFARIQNALR
ncbi:hypothetical protein [Aggregatilinea lenta]|uniref:hypothetical protein n=1 Tax=Aggregatilinea lenta TaxID=913108 RepID=UPI000E5B7E0E|nr:hypothetical protein [Aggregatilinea lenta]